jgi:hypothetical protein
MARERGVAQLEALGYRVKFARHALNSHGFVSLLGRRALFAGSGDQQQS